MLSVTIVTDLPCFCTANTHVSRQCSDSACEQDYQHHHGNYMTHLDHNNQPAVWLPINRNIWRVLSFSEKDASSY